jgi:hypothetical protein
MRRSVQVQRTSMPPWRRRLSHFGICRALRAAQHHDWKGGPAHLDNPDPLRLSESGTCPGMGEGSDCNGSHQPITARDKPAQLTKRSFRNPGWPRASRDARERACCRCSANRASRRAPRAEVPKELRAGGRSRGQARWQQRPSGRTRTLSGCQRGVLVPAVASSDGSPSHGRVTVVVWPGNWPAGRHVHRGGPV